MNEKKIDFKRDTVVAWQTVKTSNFLLKIYDKWLYNTWSNLSRCFQNQLIRLLDLQFESK